MHDIIYVNIKYFLVNKTFMNEDMNERTNVAFFLFRGDTHVDMSFYHRPLVISE